MEQNAYFSSMFVHVEFFYKLLLKNQCVLKNSQLRMTQILRIEIVVGGHIHIYLIKRVRARVIKTTETTKDDF